MAWVKAYVSSRIILSIYSVCTIEKKRRRLDDIRKSVCTISEKQVCAITDKRISYVTNRRGHMLNIANDPFRTNITQTWPSLVLLIVLEFNDTSTLMDNFVSSP